MENDQPAEMIIPQVTEHSIYETKRIGHEEFIAIRKSDTEGSSWHIVSKDGLNYGAWQSIENFAKARVLANKVALLTGVEREKAIGSHVVALPLHGTTRLSIKIIY